MLCIIMLRIIIYTLHCRFKRHAQRCSVRAHERCCQRVHLCVHVFVMCEPTLHLQQLPLHINQAVVVAVVQPAVAAAVHKVTAVVVRPAVYTVAVAAAVAVIVAVTQPAVAAAVHIVVLIVVRLAVCIMAVAVAAVVAQSSCTVVQKQLQHR